MRNSFSLLGMVGSILTIGQPVLAQLTVQVGSAPQPAVELVNHGATWHYRKGTNAPPADWHTVSDGGLDGSWLTGPGGIGFGDADDGTELTDMRNNYFTIYTRLTVQLTEDVGLDDLLQLRMDWDDGFVAYLDGREVARSSNVPGAPGTVHPHNAGVPTDHPAEVDQPGSIRLFNIDLDGTPLASGPHILAVQGINGTIDSSDVTLNVDLLLTQGGGGTLADGLFALVDSSAVDLSGTNLFPGAARVVVNGVSANFDIGSGTWSKTQLLQAGFNRIFIAALDPAGNILGSTNKDIVVQTSATTVGGTLLADTTWSSNDGIVRLSGDLTVPDGLTLRIDPGVVVLIPPGNSLIASANGTILVAGTDAEPVRFLPADAVGPFGFLQASGANASLTIQHADIASGHVDVNNGSTVLIEDSEVRNNLSGLMIEANQGAELIIRRCYIHDYSQIHIDFTPCTVEDCLIENVYSDATDFEGANFDVVVQRNTYRNGFGDNTDAFDTDNSLGIVVQDCLIHDFPDKALSIADLSDFTVARNNLIYNCGSALSAYASSNLTFVNNTAYHCQFGLYLWDREAHPGPAQGTATNNILWANTNSLLVIDGSLLEISYSDVQGTGTPAGEGNINADPLFVDPAAPNFRLQPGSPALGAGLNGVDMGVQHPVGGIPAAPFHLAAFRQSSDSIRLSWEQDAENEIGFLIARSIDAQAWELIDQVAANQTEYVQTGVDSSVQYFYRVRATNSSGVSAFSNPASAPVNETIVGGTLAADTTWSPGLGTVFVRSNVTVPAGITLTIQAGTLVRLTNNVAISANGGVINILGTSGQRVVLEPWVPGQQWNQILATGAGSALTIQHADISGGQIQLLADAIGLIEDSYIHNFYRGNTPIIHTLRAGPCTVRRCHIAFYFETNFQITLTVIEDCLFEEATEASSDALDFDGVPPGSVIRRCTFRNGIQNNTDAIDIGPTAGESSIGVLIEDCLMYNFSDKGVSIGEESFGITVRNCLIYNVTRGIQVKDISTAEVYGCTIVDCSEVGLHGFEKTPNTGGGLFTNTYNNILSANAQPIVVESDTVMVVNYSDTHGVDWTGTGNINADPLFLDPAVRDYRLANNSPCRGSGLGGVDMGITYPVGGIPLMPENLSVTTLAESAATLNWSDASNNETSFVVEHSLDGMDWTFVATFPADTSMGIVPGTFALAQAHYFRIRAANFIGESLNSNIATSATDPNDLDGDGLPNDWETDNGLDPGNAADADLDSDLDGQTNRAEYLAGTDPQDPASKLAVERVNWVASDQIELEFIAIADRAYRIEYRDSFASDVWHSLWEVPAENFTRPFVFNDFLPPGTQVRFYQIRLQ